MKLTDEEVVSKILDAYCKDYNANPFEEYKPICDTLWQVECYMEELDISISEILYDDATWICQQLGITQGLRDAMIGVVG
jgi:hypothetical protein